ncbi:MAG: hypothetical protein COA82_01795 [Alkaliphilus sp.]|nr:hypothetical protein [bacterium AH-315-G05]PHS36335.1 MAG: hypothetical protein COA82_01795 [Alkaliphilus sp.]
MSIVVDMSKILSRNNNGGLPIMMTALKILHLGTITLSKEYLAMDVEKTLDSDTLLIMSNKTYSDEDIMITDDGISVTTPERTICDIVSADLYEGYVYDAIADYDREKYAQLLKYSEKFGLRSKLQEIIKDIQEDEYSGY